MSQMEFFGRDLVFDTILLQELKHLGVTRVIVAVKIMNVLFDGRARKYFQHFKTESSAVKKIDNGNSELSVFRAIFIAHSTKRAGR